jgi:hypothetical protein
LDNDLASKIRALEMASRCLSREVRTLRLNSASASHSPTCSVEIERLVALARTILDPAFEPDSGESDDPTKAASRRRSLITRAHGDEDGSWTDLMGEGPPSANHTHALHGHGTVLPIPELIGFLGTLGKSGILKVCTQKEVFTFEFQDGEIVHGEASRAPLGQRLGDLLVSHGAVDRRTLENARNEVPTWKVGRLLLQKRFITREQLSAALRSQIQLMFNRLFREEAKVYTFWSGPPICADEGVRLNTTSVLLEGARVSDEANDALRMLGVTRVRAEAS